MGGQVSLFTFMAHYSTSNSKSLSFDKNERSRLRRVVLVKQIHKPLGVVIYQHINLYINTQNAQSTFAKVNIQNLDCKSLIHR